MRLPQIAGIIMLGAFITAVASLASAKNVSKQIGRQEQRDAVNHVRGLMAERGVSMSEIEAERLWVALKEKFDG